MNTLTLLNLPLVQRYLRLPVRGEIIAFGPSYVVLKDGKKRIGISSASAKIQKKLPFLFWSPAQILLKIAGIFASLSFGAPLAALVVSTIDAKAGSTSLIHPIDSWQDARNGVLGGNISGSGIVAASNVGGVSPTEDSFQIARYFGNFDTTYIPRLSSIESVVFVHPPVTNFENADGSEVDVTDHNGHDPINGGDFTAITLNNPTIFASLAIASLSASDPVNITLNASGRANITQQGVTQYLLRNNRDTDENFPSGVNQYSFTNSAPDIIVTYIPPGGGGIIS